MCCPRSGEEELGPSWLELRGGVWGRGRLAKCVTQSIPVSFGPGSVPHGGVCFAGIHRGTDLLFLDFIVLVQHTSFLHCCLHP